MERLGNKLNSICNWLSWRRVIELTIAFLLVRFIFSLVSHSFLAHASGYSLLAYLGGVICGIGLTLSSGRRATDCTHRWARFKKLMKESYRYGAL